MAIRSKLSARLKSVFNLPILRKHSRSASTATASSATESTLSEPCNCAHTCSRSAGATLHDVEIASRSSTSKLPIRDNRDDVPPPRISAFSMPSRPSTAPSGTPPPFYPPSENENGKLKKPRRTSIRFPAEGAPPSSFNFYGSRNRDSTQSLTLTPTKTRSVRRVSVPDTSSLDSEAKERSRRASYFQPYANPEMVAQSSEFLTEDARKKYSWKRDSLSMPSPPPSRPSSSSGVTGHQSAFSSFIRASPAILI